MGDLISRQAAVTAIEKHLNGVLEQAKFDEGIRYGYEAAHRHITEVINMLPSVESQTQQWVPIAERFPNNGQRVLMQYINGTLHVVTFSTLGLRSHIVAWMPLPEVYRGGKE